MTINPKSNQFVLTFQELQKIQGHIEVCGAIALKEQKFKIVEELNKLAELLNLQTNYTFNFVKYKNGLQYGDFTIYNDGSQSYLGEKESIGVKV